MTVFFKVEAGLTAVFILSLRAAVSKLGKGKGKGSGVWPSMVTHTQNLCSAFNPSKCIHTVVNIHLEQWAANVEAPGEQLGVRCLAQGSHLSRGIEGEESAGYSLWLESCRLLKTNFIHTSVWVNISFKASWTSWKRTSARAKQTSGIQSVPETVWQYVLGI